MREWQRRKAATIILIVKVIVISLRWRLTEIKFFFFIVVFYWKNLNNFHLSSVHGGQRVASILDYLQDVHVEEGEGDKR